MNEIKNVLLCGLGAIGTIVAVPIYNSEDVCFKILLDEKRYQKYKNNTTIFNNVPYNFDYILPDYKNFKADLIIIAVKSYNLDEVLDDIKNFVYEDTIFVSLLNGIHSESIIAKTYSDKNILTSFYLGHSSVRNGRNIENDGIYEIVTGIQFPYQKNALDLFSKFCDKTHIKYRISDDINGEYWKKFMINVGINQLSAATGLTLKQIKQDSELASDLKSLMHEAAIIAKHEKISNYELIYNSAVSFLFEQIDDAITSMLQDVMAKRHIETEIFSGEVLKLAKKYNIAVPQNEKIYRELKQKEKSYE